MDLKKSLTKRLNNVANAFGLEVKAQGADYQLYEYSSYEDYRSTQIATNEKKLKHVWADEETLDIIVARVRKEFPANEHMFALCHGARNGFEQNYIASKIDVEILGTDIAPSAAQFPRSAVWDFHDENKDWVGKCDFVYSNSIDQSWKPKLALSAWINQLKIGGLLFLEHSRDQSSETSRKSDPFGVSPKYLPYVLCEWFGHAVSIEIIHAQKGASTTWKNNVGMPTWLFVIKKNSEIPQPLTSAGVQP